MYLCTVLCTFDRKTNIEQDHRLKTLSTIIIIQRRYNINTYTCI